MLTHIANKIATFFFFSIYASDSSPTGEAVGAGDNKE